MVKTSLLATTTLRLSCPKTEEEAEAMPPKRLQVDDAIDAPAPPTKQEEKQAAKEAARKEKEKHACDYAAIEALEKEAAAAAAAVPPV